MRRRITRALLATAAAGATITTLGFAGAGSAGAAATAHKFHFAPSAPVIGTAPCAAAEGFAGTAAFPFGGGGCAGYAASGRDFRYAQAIIRIPQTNVIPIGTTHAAAGDNNSSLLAPTLYVGLTSGDAMAAAGLMTCANVVALFGETGAGNQSVCTGSINSGTVLNQWVAVGWTASNNGAVTTAHVIPLSGVSPGDGVGFAVYYPTGSTVAHFTITTFAPAASAGPHSFQLSVTAVFNHAVGVVDYSASRQCTTNATCGTLAASFNGFPLLTPGGAAIPAFGTPSTVDLRVTQFQMGAWTTVAGARGTFSGPWTLNAADNTNNGVAPPGGTIDVEPAYLWNDGLGNGSGDAFGVWWRH